jgi:hypothetical protein
MSRPKRLKKPFPQVCRACTQAHGKDEDRCLECMLMQALEPYPTGAKVTIYEHYEIVEVELK